MDYLALKMNDLESPEDVSFLVDVFYKKILEDETLSPFFAHIDFEKHKPRMEHFWNFVLFDKSGYTTNITDVHTSMKIKKAHFDSWVSIFHQTVDAYFIGSNAEKAKQRATLIAWTIGSKM